MDQIPSGFWRAVAEDFIQGQATKPLFGRRYLKFGQCFGLWGYLIELGGILGTKHGSKPDAFVPAFLGMSGEAGAAKRFIVGAADKILRTPSLTSMTFWDYVGADVTDRMGYKGVEWHSFVTERGAEKCRPEFVLESGWGYASDGAALGAIHPDVFRAMYERTHAPVPKEEWQRAYAAGLDIGSEQPQTSYAQAEASENKNFMEFCQQFRPDLYSILKD
jgi:hypothetical protein